MHTPHKSNVFMCIGYTQRVDIANNEYYIIVVAYSHDLKIVVSISQNNTAAEIILSYTYKHNISYAID